jgi:hypothetical protein
MTFPDLRADKFIRVVTNGFVIFFGSWTVLVNILVWLGMSFDWLRKIAPLWLLASVILLYAISRSDKFERPGSQGHITRQSVDSEAPAKQFLWVIPPLLLSTYYVLTNDYFLFWTASCLYLAIAYFSMVNVPFRLHPEGAMQPWETALFWVLSFIGVAATLFVHRPDADDCFYINTAVTLLEFPMAPMLASETMHSIPGAPIHMPAYRVHSIEPLTAILGHCLRLDPITVAHLLLPPIWGLMSVFSLARLFRLLLPKTWVLGLTACIVLILVNGDCHTTYGNFSFVRLFQGKAVFVSALVPLIFVYVIEFFSVPCFRNWLLLALCQISAVGMTCNALLVAPLAAGLASFACWNPSWSSTAKFFIGLTSSLYVCLIGLWLKFQFGTAVLIATGGTLRTPADIFVVVYCKGPMQWVHLVGLTGAWTFVRDKVRRKFVLTVSLGAMLLLLNPFLTEFWSSLTTNVTVWRIHWAVPVVALLAIFLTTSALELARRYQAKWSYFLFGVFLVLYVLLVPSRFTFSSSNRAEFNWPTLKVPVEQYNMARLITDLTGRGCSILAPDEITDWVPTFWGHPDPVSARHYLGMSSFYGANTAEVDRRIALQLLINNRPASPQSWNILERSLEELNIRAVVVRKDFRELSQLASILDQSGFSLYPQSNSPRYLVYSRSHNKTREKTGLSY